ncbi:MAG: S46 family peptidase [Ignavibacteriales bacterium]|nr:S46 family peptidase [Ignavibacteriales bacterium]
MRANIHTWKFIRTILLFTLPVLFIGATTPTGPDPIAPPAPDEGMYPLSEIAKLDLASAGLEIPVEEIYNPNGASLVDALARVGGCTGSFVSAEGLIITNHHCGFDFVRRASTVENNYLEDGFLAETRADEIPAEGLDCKITVGYEDVSERVLAAVEGLDVAARSRKIAEVSRQIEAEAEAAEAGVDAEVKEMFIGRSYVLFKYNTINDVRLTYVPPRSIGEFGGERDNWIWPRHTGDFTFMRAYVAPDGSYASYSPDNVPYKPKRHIRVNADGAHDGDFVFILGYPGTTFRHRPAAFVDYHERVRLPLISDAFGEIIDAFEELGEDDPERALELASIVKSLANVYKNYNGKMLGLRRIDLVERKKEEERELRAFIDATPELADKYGGLLDEIDATYEPLFSFGKERLAYWTIDRLVGSHVALESLVRYVDLKGIPESERPEKLDDDELEAKKHQLLNFYYDRLDFERDRATYVAVFRAALEHPELRTVAPFSRFADAADPNAAVEEFFREAFESSVLVDRDALAAAFEKTHDELVALNDPLVETTRRVAYRLEELDARKAEIDETLNLLEARLLDVKKAWKQERFIPDANSTLRLTYGYVRGYSPVDATYYNPITTLKGVVEKSYIDDPVYDVPEILYKLYERAAFGRFYDEKVGGVPVGLLYNMDTTGGNSGSPILDSKGRLVGVNFDRAYEATINDYAWDESYSRSIGVDIRYVLWTAWQVGGADALLAELGVDL